MTRVPTGRRALLATVTGIEPRSCGSAKLGSVTKVALMVAARSYSTVVRESSPAPIVMVWAAVVSPAWLT